MTRPSRRFGSIGGLLGKKTGLPRRRRCRALPNGRCQRCSMLLMLEDNAERLQRFATTLQRIDPALEVRIWRNAWTMIREIEPLLPLTRIISLDHDLDPEE